MKHRFLAIICLIASSLTVLAPANAKELRLAYDEGPGTLDIQERLSVGVLQLSHLSFDPLVRFTRDLTFEPRLATGYERLNPTRVRFYLRRGVRFHSGNRLTATDFKFSFDRLKRSPDFESIFNHVAKLEIIDDFTIDLVTDRPYPLLLHAATYIFPLDSRFYSGTDDNGVDKAVIVKQGNSFASSNLSGTGPFRVVAYNKERKLVLERFDDYWDENANGNVSRIVLTPMPEESARVEALLTGSVDFIGPVSPPSFERIGASGKTELITMTGTRIITLQMNQQRRAEFRDPRVRLAMVLAIDNAGIARKVMQGFATPAAQFSPAGFSGHNPNLKPRFDLGLARQLMRDAGYPDGFKITMMAPNNRYLNDEKIARAVAAMLARINVVVDLKTLPKAQYWPAFDDRAADVMMIGWRSDTGDSANFFEFLVMTPDPGNGYGVYNSGHYSNEFVDSMIMRSKAETDMQKRAQMLRDIEAKIFQDAGIIPLHWQKLAWAARRGVNAGSIVNPLNIPYLADLVID